jgi:hypothetical protein
VAIVLAPLGAVAWAAVRWWGQGITVIDVVLALTLYAVVGHGVTIGFHRLFAHRSFSITDVIMSSRISPAIPIRRTALAPASAASSVDSGTPMWAGSSTTARRRGVATPVTSSTILTSWS